MPWDFWRRRPRISDGLWHGLLNTHPFLGWRSTGEVEALRGLSSEFLARKEFHGAQGLNITDEMALSVAAQACLPILHLGLQAYDGFVGIVMHEGPVRAKREVVGDDGLVHTYDEELVGEAVEGGPVMLSWHLGAAPGSNGLSPLAASTRAYNVVIHEFVHLLDLLDGQFDGTPPMAKHLRAQWQAIMQTAFDRFDERSACGYASVVDTYGAQDIGEFFAVTAEAFFTLPLGLQDEMPDLYRLYTGFFKQDTAAGQREFDQA